MLSSWFCTVSLFFMLNYHRTVIPVSYFRDRFSIFCPPQKHQRKAESWNLFEHDSVFCLALPGCPSWENSDLLAWSSPSFCCECSPSESAWTGRALKEGSWSRGEKGPWKDALCWLFWTGRGFSLSGGCGSRPAARTLGPSRWQELNHLEWRGPSWSAQRGSQSAGWPELVRLGWDAPQRAAKTNRWCFAGIPPLCR